MTDARTRAWRVPAALAMATLLGLLLALTGGAQPWRAIAWGLLSSPLIVGVVAWRRQSDRRRRAP